MQTRISHMLSISLLLLACIPVFGRLAAPPFPPDPGVVYVPPTVTVMGQTIVVDTTDTSATVLPEEIDIFEDSTVIFNTVENTLTISNASLEVGDSTQAAISYSGTETLVIILCDSSSIFADTIIASQSDIIITGDGILEAEGTVPIIGAETARIIFDSVNMHVRSTPSPEALRRRIRYGKKLDENGGPALSGFASADFNKTAVTPPEAEYGAVEVEEASGGPGGTSTINALYTVDQDGNVEVLSEFTLTDIPDKIDDAVEDIRVRHELDITKPMYNILGLQVDASYRGIVIQQGCTFLLK